MPQPYSQKLQNSANRGCLTRGPARARIVVALFSVAVLAAWLPSSDAARLDYFALFGEWSVICTADEAAQERICAMEAPALDPDRPRNAIEVRQGQDGEPQIGIRRRTTVNTATPVFLRIDAYPPHRATPTPSGDVFWLASDASRIIEEMKNGSEIVLRTFSGNENRPRDEFISLNGFDQAWQAYRLQSEQSVPAGPDSED